MRVELSSPLPLPAVLAHVPVLAAYAASSGAPEGQAPCPLHPPRAVQRAPACRPPEGGPPQCCSGHACVHTHRALWSAAGWPHVLCWACASAPPLWAQLGHCPTSVASLVRTRVLEALSLPVLRWPSPLGGGHGAAAAPVRAMPYVCSAQPTRSRRSLSAQPGHCLRGRGAFLTCLLDPRDGALWAEASFTSNWTCLLSAETRRTQASCSPPDGRSVLGPAPAGLPCPSAETVAAEGNRLHVGTALFSVGARVLADGDSLLVCSLGG